MFTVTWEIAPDAQLVPNITTYEQNIMKGLGTLAQTFAASMQGQAQGGAPWNDVTGAARAGLLGQAMVAATQVTIYLLHSVHYGPYLEMGTSRMAPRPIILPTLQQNYGPVMAAVRALLTG